MNSIPRLQGIDLAKENYALLQQVGPKAELHVDGFGKLYAQEQSRSIFKALFSNKSAKLDEKEVAQAKMNAQIWGHLIPDIKGLQAKERLSEIDAGLIQGMADEIERLRKQHPEFVDRMKELLDRMGERLNEQACRYLEQTPIAEEVETNSLGQEPFLLDPKQIEEVLDELKKLRELVYEGKHVKPEPERETPSHLAPQMTDAQAAHQFVRALQQIHPAEMPDAKNEKSEGWSIGFHFNNGVGLASSLAVGAGMLPFQAINAVGLASSLAVGAGMLPFQAIKRAAEVLLAPNLVQRCLGLSNFKNALQELTKSKVWVPARVGGKVGVLYKGPEEIERVVPAFGYTVGDDNSLFNVEIPEDRVKTSLKNIDWEPNPLLNRLKAAGTEMIIGSAKMAFWTLAASYLVGRFANNHEMCTDDCNLESPTIASALKDYASQLWNRRADHQKCDRLEKDYSRICVNEESAFHDLWNKNYCDGASDLLIESIAERNRSCDLLTETYTKKVTQLEAQEQAFMQEYNCNNANRNVYKCEALEAYSKKLQDEEYKVFSRKWKMEVGCHNIPEVSNAETCEGFQKKYDQIKENLAEKFRQNWAENFCDDEKPGPIFLNLLADMKKNPLKYPMNFARGVDAAIETFKGPAKETLRGLIGIAQYLSSNPTMALYGGEFIAIAGMMGYAEQNARASTNIFSCAAWRGAVLSAFVAGCLINTINREAGAFYDSAIRFNATEAFGL